MDIMLVTVVVGLFLTVVPRGIGKAITLTFGTPILGLALGGFIWTISLFIFGVPSSWSAVASSFLAFFVVASLVTFGVLLWALYFSDQ